MLETFDESARDRAGGRITLGRRLISNAFLFAASGVKETRFLKDLKHDADLVPRVTEQLNLLLDSLQRDSAIAYDIQGRSDYGCDVLVRLTTGTAVTFVGVQIKSHSEVAEKGISTLLRDQHSRVVDLYAPHHRFYIFLAADISTHRSRQQESVMAIQQAFAKKQDVEIVGPQYAATFLRLPRTAMDGLLTRTAREGDPVLSTARRDLSRNPLDAAVVLYLLVASLEGRAPTPLRELVTDPWLNAVSRQLPSDEATALELSSILNDPEVRDRLVCEGFEGGEEDFEFYGNKINFLPPWLIARLLKPDWNGREHRDGLASRIPKLLESLDEEVEISGTTTNPRVVLRLDQYPALVCLAAEARVKHDLDGADLVSYLVDAILSPTQEEE
ncbi:hypothetical protein [Dactylosporangium sp. CA-233914]|uniref:hypothetical protein n=1 Tax=Dactylosporangium sp. CA-233914 TaxID=3239934 RepID=UPI003D9274A7